MVDQYSYRWHVLYVRARTEKRIAALCKARNLPTDLPLRQETKIRKGRKIKVEQPVFPGYVFAALNHAARDELFRTGNLLRVMEPTNTETMLRELHQVHKALSADPSLRRCTMLTRGTEVRITTGPFMGVEGKVFSLKGRTRVRLNVEMIGQAVEVTVDKDLLELID
jgi:transcription antitermination factor NusG